MPAKLATRHRDPAEVGRLSLQPRFCVDALSGDLALKKLSFFRI
jgi:hypothetical protein